MSNYKEYFAKLKIARIKGQSAPHKYVMLLSIIDLFESEEIKRNSILLNDSLDICFQHTWKKYVGDNSVFKPISATPFSNLINEPFWTLYDTNGNKIERFKNTPSISFFKKNNISAMLSSDLYEDMLIPEKREEMRSIIISKYLNQGTKHNDRSESSDEAISVISGLTDKLEKAIYDNDSLTRIIHDQESITANLALQVKSEILERDERIARLENEIKDLNSALESLRGILEKVPKQVLPEAEIVPSGLDEYKFLKRVDDKDMPELPDDYRSIKYVYSKQDRAHYEIQHYLLHEDENMLSTLRVRLYEQYQNDPNRPLLVCSCCRRPVLLTGNSGIKGEIIGFRHHGETNVRTGEHEGEFFGIPKQETIGELQPLKDCFAMLKHQFVDYKEYYSFILLPGSDRKKAIADVSFSFNGQRIAVIFASVSHPLDFIIRRTRAAHDMGYVPIWILSSSFFNSSALSNRDISTFSKGFLFTIDEEVVGESEYHAVPCIKVRDFYSNTISIVRLSAVISSVQDALEDLMKRPEWDGAMERVRRPRISKPKKPSVTNSERNGNDIIKAVVPKTKKTISAIDYWKGKRQLLKDDLYLERLDSGIGIVDLKTHRYPVLPFYDRARFSEDNSVVEFYLKGELRLQYKI